MEEGRAERYRRFGGELPLGCDRLGPERPEAADVLGFSHGRAALGWLVATRGPFAAALISAYTCPSVPACLRGLGLRVACFDVGAPAGMLEAMVGRQPGRCLVLVPALLGFDPWLDAHALAGSLGDRAVVVVDAAQTAFGHRRYRPPPGGAVLSCPRKLTALADGACLRLDGAGAVEQARVAALPVALAPAAAKYGARALFARRDPGFEPAALALAAAAEAGWPATPHRMTGRAWRQLSRIDAAAHDRQRLINRARLRAALERTLPSAVGGAGVPFGHAVLVDNRARLLAALHARRVFATALWPMAEHDPTLHPAAATLARRLLVLPIDQRYREPEIDQLAALVLAAWRAR